MHGVNEPHSVPRRVFIAGAAATMAAAACSTDTAPSASSASTDTATTTSSLPAAPAFLSSGGRDRQQVALTFHVSGDRAVAVRLLDLLKAHAVPITAFIVGTW